MDILVWKNKYDDRYLAANTEEELELSARSILRELIQDRWIPKPEASQFTEEELEVLAMTEEQLAALPKTVRESVLREREVIETMKSQDSKDSAEYDFVVSILNDTAEPICIRRRSKYSDEDWDKIIEASKKWRSATEEREDGLYRKPSAWSVLQDRDGGEYEYYSIETVEVPKEA